MLRLLAMLLLWERGYTVRGSYKVPQNGAITWKGRGRDAIPCPLFYPSLASRNPISCELFVIQIRQVPSQESAKLLKASLASDSRDPENTDRVKHKIYMQKVVPLISSEIVKVFARASWLGRGGDGAGAGEASAPLQQPSCPWQLQLICFCRNISAPNESSYMEHWRKEYTGRDKIQIYSR